MTTLALLIASVRGKPRRARPARLSAPVAPSAAEPRSGALPPAMPPYARRATIHVYAAQGMSREEIVRRTGFAYDAVALLVPGDRGTRPPEASA